MINGRPLIYIKKSATVNWLLKLWTTGVRVGTRVRVTGVGAEIGVIFFGYLNWNWNWSRSSVRNQGSPEPSICGLY